MARPTNSQKQPPLSRTVWAEIVKNMYISGISYKDLVPLLGFRDEQPLRNRENDPDLVKICEVEQICKAMGLQAEIHITKA